MVSKKDIKLVEKEVYKLLKELLKYNTVYFDEVTEIKSLVIIYNILNVKIHDDNDIHGLFYTIFKILGFNVMMTEGNINKKTHENLDLFLTPRLVNSYNILSDNTSFKRERHIYNPISIHPSYEAVIYIPVIEKLVDKKFDPFFWTYSGNIDYHLLESVVYMWFISRNEKDYEEGNIELEKKALNLLKKILKIPGKQRKQYFISMILDSFDWGDIWELSGNISKEYKEKVKYILQQEKLREHTERHSQRRILRELIPWDVEEEYFRRGYW